MPITKVFNDSEIAILLREMPNNMNSNPVDRLQYIARKQLERTMCDVRTALESQPLHDIFVELEKYQNPL